MPAVYRQAFFNKNKYYFRVAFFIKMHYTDGERKKTNRLCELYIMQKNVPLLEFIGGGVHLFVYL